MRTGKFETSNARSAGGGKARLGDTRSLIWQNIAIYLIFILLVTPTALGKLHRDELFFLTCSFDAASQGGLSACYPLSIYPYLVSLFVPAPGFVEGVLLYRCLNLVLLWILPAIISLLAFGKSATVIPRFNLALICTGIFYAATVRQVEIRPEFLAGTGLALGALTGLSARFGSRWRLGLALVLLALAIAISPRLIPTGGLLISYILTSRIEAFWSRNPARRPSSKILTFATALAAMVVLLLVAFLLFNSTAILKYLTSGAHLDMLHKFVINGLGNPLHIVPDNPLTFFNILVFLVRPTMILLAVAAGLALMLQAVKSRLLSPGLLGLVPFAWVTTLLLDPRPFAYVVILEASVLSILFWGHVKIQGLRSWYPKLALAFLGVTLIGGLQANTAHWHARFGLIDPYDLPAENAPMSELLDAFEARNFVVQLTARRRFCQEYQDYTLAVAIRHLAVCRSNYEEFFPWESASRPGEFQNLPRPGYFEDLFDHPKVLFSMPLFDPARQLGIHRMGDYWVLE